MPGSPVQTATPGNGNSDTVRGVTFATAPANGNKVVVAIGSRAPSADTETTFTPTGGAKRDPTGGSTDDTDIRVYEWTGDGTTTTFSVTFNNPRAWSAIGWEMSGLGAYDTGIASTTATATSRSSGTTGTLASANNYSLTFGQVRDSGRTSTITTASLSKQTQQNTGGPTVRTTCSGAWRASTGSTAGISDTIAWDGTATLVCTGVWVWQEAAVTDNQQMLSAMEGLL